MEFNEVAHRRRMVRSYDQARTPDRDVITDLIGLATRAPSAGFSQGWHFLVLDEPRAVESFWLATTESAQPADTWLRGMRTAPVLIVVMSEPAVYLDRYAEPDKGWSDRDVARWPVPYWDVDAGMASMLILLGVVDKGLGACFFGVPPKRHRALRDAFRIPDDRNIVGVISVGYPAQDSRSPSLRRGKRPVADVVSFGAFQMPRSFT